MYKIQQKKKIEGVALKIVQKKKPAWNADQLAKKNSLCFPALFANIGKNIKCLYIIMWYCVQNGIKHAKLENYSKCLIFDKNNCFGKIGVLEIDLAEF